MKEDDDKNQFPSIFVVIFFMSRRWYIDTVMKTCIQNVCVESNRIKM